MIIDDQMRQAFMTYAQTVVGIPDLLEHLDEDFQVLINMIYEGRIDELSDADMFYFREYSNMLQEEVTKELTRRGITSIFKH